MGWFEDQMKQRKQLDEKTFEQSFQALAGLSPEDQDLSRKAQRENFAISQILSYFHHPMTEIPAAITDFKEKVNYAIKPYDILYREVTMSEALLEEDSSPILAFAESSGAPAILWPTGKGGYYYFNFKTRKKRKLDPLMYELFEPTAYRFYRPLPPSGKISLKEYSQYIRQSIRPIDIVLLILLAAVVSGVGLLLPFLTRELTGRVVHDPNDAQFFLVSAYVVATATGLLLLKAFQSFLNSRIGVKIEKSILEATMMRVLSLPTSFFKKFNTGELTARFYTVPRLADTILNGVVMTSVSVIMSLAYLGQLVSFAPILIPIVVLILLSNTGFTVAISLIQRKHTRSLLELSSKEAGVSYEMINGIQKIRLSGSEKRVFAKWASAYSRSAKVRYRPPMILRLATAISLLISLLGNVALYYAAAKTGISVADYMAFVTSYGVLSGAFGTLAAMVGVIASIQPMFEMARPILEAEPESKQGKKIIESIGGNISVSDLSFRYNENGPDIISHLNLDIKEGEYIAIVGQTGCGKSTLVRLLLGFESPTTGKVCYDGVDIADVDPSSLRRHIGTVMQNGTLFHADIFSNIIISSPGLTEKEAWEAAEIADIAKDIREMPMGMKTVISEGQGGISGGQKQRIMIARAIVHKPKILIFDEATSALDNKTQKSISDAVSKLHCTRIVIAHRLSTIKNVDRIIMLEGGKIVEEGNYQSLIDQKGKFAELVERQRLDNN